VDLSWDAPASSADPVVGYNVYRSPNGVSAYQQINTTMVAQTSYVDLTVQAGQSYDYIVRSVDAAGVASVPSNTATAPIP
jgi:fibronectin type 3 domain-containing protein